MTASLIAKVPYAEFAEKLKNKDPQAKSLRSFTKQVVFGILYGMGSASLARDLGISVIEAEKFISEFFQRFPQSKKWIDAIHAHVHKVGYVVNIFGRVRRLPGIFSRDTKIVSLCERQSINSIVQSTAADITNIALPRIHDIFRNRNLPARIVMTVHDSIVSEVRDDYVEECGRIMKTTMELKPHPDFKVKLKADTDVFQRWGVEI
jgi:DNA polymerase-1